MVSVKLAAFAGMAALFTTAASAADLPPYLPPIHMPPPPIEEAATGWYLRGDIGMTNQEFKGLFQRLYNTPGTSVEQVGQGWDSSPFFGIGLGYKLNDWLRADVTGEYRGKATFHGSDNVRFDGGQGVDNYSGSKSEWVFLANAYVDLGTWAGITPYIGVGIGTAYNKIHSFRDDGIIFIGGNLTNGVAYADDASKWNLAWAVHAGLTYKVTPSMSIDLGYRYIDLGSAETGPTRAFDGSFVNGGPFIFNDIYSHDFKLGVRWMLEPPAPPPQPYMMPPLMRRG
jgi:opacity protein-like surface antigen